MVFSSSCVNSGMPVKACPSGKEVSIFQGERAQQNDVVET